MCLRTNPEPAVIGGTERFGIGIERSRYGYKWLPKGKTNYTRVTSIVKHLSGDPTALIRWNVQRVTDVVSEIGVRLGKGELKPVEAAIMLSSEAIEKAGEDALAKAGDFGTLAHRFIEAWAGGNSIDTSVYDTDLLDRLEYFVRWVEDVKPNFGAVETFMFHDDLLYAGTCDCFCRIGSETWMIDWKTSKSIRDEYLLQLAGYRYAQRVGWADGTSNPVPKVDKCGIGHVTPTGFYLYEVPVRREVEYERFLDCLRLYRYSHEKVDRKTLCSFAKSEAAA